MASSHKDHQAMIKFRQLIFQDRMEKTQGKGKIVTSRDHAAQFGFLSNPYFNRIENGAITPSLETFLDMLDILGYDIAFVKKQATPPEQG
jgi:hypothetical protein